MKLKMWKNLSKVDFTSNSDRLSEYLSYIIRSIDIRNINCYTTCVIRNKQTIAIFNHSMSCNFIAYYYYKTFTYNINLG